MTTTYQTLYFKNVVEAENFAKQTGNHFESSSTEEFNGQVFCFRVYDDELKCTHKLVVDDTCYENAANFERGE